MSRVFKDSFVDDYGFIIDDKGSIDSYNEFNKYFRPKQERRLKRFQNFRKKIQINNNIDYYSHRHDEQFKKLCRKGIPDIYRNEVYSSFYCPTDDSYRDVLTGEIKTVKLIDESVLVGVDFVNISEQTSSQIELDIVRTFVHNIHFREDTSNTLVRTEDTQVQYKISNGISSNTSPTDDTPESGLRSSLLNSPQLINSNSNLSSNTQFATDFKNIRRLRLILINFSILNPQIGYCQGINFIAATCLLICSFNWRRATLLLHSLVKHLDLSGYFVPNMTQLQVDIRAIEKLTADKKIIDSSKFEFAVSWLASEWLHTLFTSILPFTTCLRIFDCFLCEGRKIIIRITLAIFKIYSYYLYRGVDFYMILLKTELRNLYDHNFLVNTAFRRLGTLRRREIVDCQLSCEHGVLAELEERRSRRENSKYLSNKK